MGVLLAVLVTHAAHAADWRETETTFPLRVSQHGSYLEDASGRPFLVNGDTSWSLIAELRREEVEAYLADRRRRGFNALLVNLIEHQFSSNAPANAYRKPPFETGKAFSSMNDRYFDHAAWILERAEEMGFVVFLTPAYLGANGSDQGWYRQVAEAGREALQSYGTYIARRFSERRNVIWVHGGDFDAPDKDLVRAIVSGIEHVAPGSLHTVHSTRDTVTAEYWAGDDWLSVDTAYTYEDAHAAVLARTGDGSPLPVLFIEGLYEGEHGTDEEMIRQQAYGAMLAGAAGQIFGNNPIWHLSSGGLYETEKDWRGSLDSRGAESMTHFRDLFDGLAWWLILPEGPNGGVSADGLVYAASASDRSFRLVYALGTTVVKIDQGGVDEERYEVRWFDPSNGRWHASETRSARAGSMIVSPPAPRNAAGYRDWVVLIRPSE